MLPIEFTRGDTVVLDTFVLYHSEAPSTPVDMTGAAIKFTVKTAYSDADVDAVFQKTDADDVVIAGDGLSATITIQPADTSTLSIDTTQRYLSDVQVVEASGRISTPAEWRRPVIVHPDVTLGA